MTAGLLLLLLGSALGLGIEPAGTIGVAEKTGQTIPSDVRCVNEKGQEFPLLDLIDRPTILSLVYYSCEHICPQLLSGLGQLIQSLGLDPKRDYRVITLSFDSEDTGREAALARRNYTKPLGPGFPEEAWSFLVAAQGDIEKLTDALGFSYQKEEHGFTHPVILAIIAPGGKICRYVYASKYHYGVGYPVTFSKVDIEQSLRAAARGEIYGGASSPLLFCFPHEPEGQVESLRLMRIAGWGTLVGLAFLFVYLAAGRKRPKESR